MAADAGRLIELLAGADQRRLRLVGLGHLRFGSRAWRPGPGQSQTEQQQNNPVNRRWRRRRDLSLMPDRNVSIEPLLVING